MTPFEDYSGRLAPYFAMRRDGGVLEVRMHREGHAYSQTLASHNAWGLAWSEIGADRDNEVVILTGTGDRWVDGRGRGDPDYFRKEFGWQRSPGDVAKVNHDARKLVEALIHGVHVPTIAAVNGPGAHTEIALACDITICAPHAELFDPHFLLARAPGDGQGLAFQHVLGTSGAAITNYSIGRLDAVAALRTGLVAEVVPAGELLARAWEIARRIMARPAAVRRMIHAIATRPWQRALVADFGEHHYRQSFAARTDVGAAGATPDLNELRDHPL